MKILQINCVYNKGSTGKIVYDIHTELLRRGYESVVCYGRGKRIKEPHVYKTCSEWYSKLNHLFSYFTGIMYGGCLFSTWRLIRIIEKEKPTVVHLHCINGYFVNIYQLIAYLKKHGIPTVLTLHAEFMYTANCGHALDCERWKSGCGHCPRWRKETKSFWFDRTAASWKRMKAAFDGFDNLVVVAVSHWIEGRAAKSDILINQRIIVIHNGIRTELFSSNSDNNDRKRLYQLYSIPEQGHLVLHVTPSLSSSVKGGEQFLKLAELFPFGYQAVIVGCDKGTNDRIVSVPFVSNQQELAMFYRAADVLIITSKADNYPTVCIEANCCGTPVVGFDVGGVSETIGAGLGETVNPFDMSALYSKTMYWCDRKKQIPVDVITARRLYCSKERMVNDYLNVYKKIEPSSRLSGRLCSIYDSI